MPLPRLLSKLSLLGVLAGLACGSDTQAPSAPVSPIPATPTPTPVATATPNPDVPPADSGCGKPYPPPISRFYVKVHYKQHEFWNLDSTPIVGYNQAYCAKIGYTDGRALCPVRTEGARDRVACENWRVGHAKDTGLPGPTWSLMGPGGQETYCLAHMLGHDECRHHPSNPYQLLAQAHGNYKVCTESGVCGVVYVDR